MQKKLIKLMDIYNILLKYYGYQGWWPINSKYHPKDYSLPKTENEMFEIMVGTILTQNTSWKNVEKAIHNLHNKKIMSVEGILKTSQKALAKLIKPAGYYNQKSERIILLAKYLQKNYDSKPSKMFKKDVKDLKKELLNLKGIGNETADSIILYAAKKPIFVVDAYTKRIFSRMGFFKENETYENVQKFFMQNLKSNYKLYNEYHALIVELAKRSCIKKKICEKCIVKKFCRN
jgi:endonuclease-3 related protein